MGRSSGYTQMQKQYPMYGYQQANAQHMSQKQAPNPNQYPVHPDVKFKRLPFYDILGELIKPSSLSMYLTFLLNFFITFRFDSFPLNFETVDRVFMTQKGCNIGKLKSQQR